MFFAQKVKTALPGERFTRSKGRKMSTISILLVEDSSADIAIIKEFLSKKPSFSFELQEAETLEAALSLQSSYDFDVVLLDLGLPDSSGLDTARRIIAQNPEAAVIILASPEDEEVALQAVHYGAEDHLPKRVLSAVLLGKSILYAIEHKKVLQEKFDILSDLVLALEKIEYLEGMLPICVGCKKIYHENKRWLSLEDYANQLSGSETPRSICPDCLEDIANNS